MAGVWGVGFRVDPSRTLTRCPANVAHVRQSKPHSGLSFQAQILDF